jgi:hypothetical protein
MKPGNKVIVIDDPIYAEKIGVVVATATTSDVSAVSVRFTPTEGAIWFFRNQLKNV